MSSMSFLGAMAGLGQGMQHYSTLLGEKRKKDWEEQAQIAKDQRYQNLLKLQNDWTAKREEDRDTRGHTNRLSELEAGRVSALTQAKELAYQNAELSQDPKIVAGMTAQAEWTRTQAGLSADDENKRQLIQQESLNQINLKHLFKVQEENLKFTQKQRDQNVQSFLGSDYAAGLDKSTRDMYVFSIKQPEIAAAIASFKKEIHPTVQVEIARVASTAYNEALLAWDNLKGRERQTFTASLPKERQENAREEYADAMSAKQTDAIFGVLGLSSTGTTKNSPDFNKFAFALEKGETSVEEGRARGVKEIDLVRAAMTAGTPYTPPPQSVDPNDIVGNPSAINQAKPNEDPREASFLAEQNKQYNQWDAHRKALEGDKGKEREAEAQAKKQEEQAIQTLAVQLYNAKHPKSTVSNYRDIPNTYVRSYTRDAKKAYNKERSGN